MKIWSHIPDGAPISSWVTRTTSSMQRFSVWFNPKPIVTEATLNDPLPIIPTDEDYYPRFPFTMPGAIWSLPPNNNFPDVVMIATGNITNSRNGSTGTMIAVFAVLLNTGIFRFRLKYGSRWIWQSTIENTNFDGVNDIANEGFTTTSWYYWTGSTSWRTNGGRAHIIRISPNGSVNKWSVTPNVPIVWSLT